MKTRSPWFLDPAWLLFLVVGGGAIFFTLPLYPPPLPPTRFPKNLTDFRSPTELQKAKSTALAAIETNPEDMAAHVELAMVSFEGGGDHYVKGLDYLERARDLGVLDERLFYYAGVMYEAQGLPEYAVPEYEKYLRRHPEDLETRLRLANLFYRLEDYDKSIEGYRVVLVHTPNDPLVSFNLAMAYREKKKWGEGLDVLKPFLELGSPLPTGAQRLLGDLYLGAGETQRAWNAYEKERVISGESADLAALMASVAEKLGQKDQAIERWKKVLTFDPNNRQARTRLRRLK
ncbi:MAG: tetratricopeptide repeat protein [Elusimicrobia bacterium]|jgi:tetratricopeptide (TPR) repeat protein|nr:tetratricopeptide repeat protein [Elusimicrobiota bacterium]